MICDQNFHRLLDAVPVRLWCTGPTGSRIYFNRVWHEFLGDAYVPSVPIDQAFQLHPDDPAILAERFGALIAGHEHVRIEFRLRRHDGVWRWMLCNGRPRTTAAGDYAGFIGSCTDITDRHDAEAERQRELDDKVALMQELHHRVKNNAQVFASLLSVQANRARDPAVKAALNAAAARAATMAVTQQQIWDAGPSARFDLVALIQRLVRANQARNLDIAVDAPASLLVPLATAVPLGLILHELLANARDHAFPDGRPGTVRVSAHRTGPATLTLAVADDGIGMPAPDTAKSSVGLTIVKSLVRQLSAQLVTHPGPGTHVRLEMRCPPP